MLNKLSAILFFLVNCAAHMVNHQWDMAVAVGDQIKFLNSTGTVVGAVVDQFSTLKALSYDYVHHQFLLSDMDKEMDTIFKVQLTSEQTTVIPIVKDLPDDVQGLAIDPITNILYWTDSVNKTINYVSLKDPSLHSNRLLDFKDDSPQDIAIDICRRYIYWTNSNIMGATIGRASLDGHDREVLVSEDLTMPTGLAVDFENGRIYWADHRPGIYFRIESIYFNGSGRQIVYEGTHGKPFGVAVDGDYVYWTDIANNELYRKNKFNEDPPERMQRFNGVPRGLVVKDVSFTHLEKCKDVEQAIESFKGTTTEYFLEDESSKRSNECLNHGEFKNGGCHCPRGFTGQNCEISLCYNFCVHGECHFSSLSYPQCRCPIGFVGSRCQKSICDGYCLNDGKCSVMKNSTRTPACRCSDGFTGMRCERSTELSQICETYCSQRHAATLIDKENKIVCMCIEGSYKILEEWENFTSKEQKSVQEASIWEHAEEPVIIILSMCMLVMVVLIIILASFVCKLRRRPRIKKRIIVNKNITPLTYRPQPPTEQCEITIENCCNMNVCETPCFEPSNFSKSKKEEKKNLLSNMENGEDMY